jgi:cysteine desulfurase family protein (TIGR01976 family)
MAPVSYDVAAIRACFPALAEGAAHFDGPGGTQVPEIVGTAVAATLTAAVANRGTVTPAERRAEAVVRQCRAALADLLGADPRGIVVGRSATALTYELSRALARTWAPGDEVVVTRLDHDANVRPWVQAAEAAGATVRWAGFDPTTGEQQVDDVAPLLTDRTRLVAVTAASNLIGTRPPVHQIAERVHEAGALLWVDGVHATAHAPVDVRALGADVWTCSPYKFLGPHCGVAAADPTLLESLHPDKLLPSTDDVPERFELGTLPYELMAGTTAAVEFLAWLGRSGEESPPTWTDPYAVSSGSVARRAHLLASIDALEAHEEALRERAEKEIRAMRGVTMHSNARARTPTLLLTFAEHDPQDVRHALAERGVNAPAGHFYAIECSRHLGLGDAGGLRVGLAPYTDDRDVDRLLDGLADVTSR